MKRTLLLADVHLAPVWSVALAVAVSGLLVWYWHRLGRADVPGSRRRIRRMSLALMLLSLPMFVRALSFVDPNVDHRAYVTTWTLATFIVLLVIVTAITDAVNNLRLHQTQRHEALHEAAIELAEAARERQRTATRTARVQARHASAGDAEEPS